MKKYEYVRIKISKVFGSKLDEHRKLINENAKKGYRFVGYLPTIISDYGKFKEIDLVFEIDC